MDISFQCKPRFPGFASQVNVSQHVVEQTRALAKAQDKRLMVLLSYSTPYLEALIEDQPRVDQGFLDYLKISELPFVDTLENHAQNYRCCKLSVQDYAQRFWIPHYTPLGNHFFAFAIKDAVVSWLEPKPITYRNDGFSYGEIVSGLA